MGHTDQRGADATEQQQKQEILTTAARLLRLVTVPFTQNRQEKKEKGDID